MRAVAPRTGAPEVTIGEEQPAYKTITVAVYDQPQGRVLLTRWRPNDEELMRLMAGADIYVAQLVGPNPMTPMTVSIDVPEGF